MTAIDSRPLVKNEPDAGLHGVRYALVASLIGAILLMILIAAVMTALARQTQHREFAGAGQRRRFFVCLQEIDTHGRRPPQGDRSRTRGRPAPAPNGCASLRSAIPPRASR